MFEFDTTIYDAPVLVAYEADRCRDERGAYTDIQIIDVIHRKRRVSEKVLARLDPDWERRFIEEAHEHAAGWF